MCYDMNPETQGQQEGIEPIPIGLLDHHSNHHAPVGSPTDIHAYIL